MFVFVILIGLNFEVGRFLQSLMTAIITPFCLFIYPGIFYYLVNLAKLEDEIIKE
jgi:hypothetical protein